MPCLSDLGMIAAAVIEINSVFGRTGGRDQWDVE